eukprot:6187396-Pyramimonas_sp.AAC.1
MAEMRARGFNVGPAWGGAMHSIIRHATYGASIEAFISNIQNIIREKKEESTTADVDAAKKAPLVDDNPFSPPQGVVMTCGNCVV